MTQAAALATWALQGHVVAVSAQVAESLRRVAHGRVPVSVVSNGVDVDAFGHDVEGGRDVRARFQIDAAAPVIGTVTVFREAKRLDLWMRAAEAIAREVADVRFLVVGFGPTEPEVRRAVSLHGLEHRVVLAGPQTDVRPFLSAMDVFLMSSDYEGLPIALLEAMAAARPVVATAVGGIPEVVRGDEGRLVDAGDVDGLVRAVVELLRDPIERQRMGAAGRSRVQAAAGIARMASELHDRYADVVAGARRPL